MAICLTVSSPFSDFSIRVASFQPRMGPLAIAGATMFGPGFKTVDFSIFKNTHITETVYVQFRAEVFNGFNHSNYDQVSGGQEPNFGRIFNEKDARELQFGLKIIF